MKVRKRCVIAFAILFIFLSSLILVDSAVAKKEISIDSEIEQKLNVENQSEVRVAVILENVEDKRAEQDIEILGLEKDDFKLTHKAKSINAFEGRLTKKGLEKLRKNPNVARIEADKEMKLFLDDSIYLINADEMWQVNENNYTGNEIGVCVLDTGIDWTHPAFGGCQAMGENCKVVWGYDFYNNNADAFDRHGHGTHVAGIVASADAVYRGVAPNAKLFAMKVCSDGGICSSNAIGNAIDWCLEHKDEYNIKIITMSLGTEEVYSSSDCQPYFYATEIINKAYDNGIFISVASGNSGSINGIAWPACARGAISVGASTKSDSIASYSNRHETLDILAPGSAIYSANYQWQTGSDFVSKSGTSMAAPHAAGAAALLFSYNSSYKPDDIKQFLQEYGKQIYDSSSKLTFSRIDFDVDNDNVATINDECPLISGSVNCNGCPIEQCFVDDEDDDDDGILDENDACPLIAGSFCNGCPEINCTICQEVYCPTEGMPQCANKNITAQCGNDYFEYGCAWGFELGNDVAERLHDFHCNGFGACIDDIFEWQIHQDCNENEFCTNSENNYFCENILDYDFEILSPLDNSQHNSRHINLTIISEKLMQKIEYSLDNSAYRTLAKEKYNYSSRKSFADGPHILKIKVTYPKRIVEKTIYFLTDSRAPRIYSQKPYSRRETNGSFTIRYREENLQEVSLIVNNGIVAVRDDCPSSTRIETCNFEIDLSEFQEQQINYTFKLKDPFYETYSRRTYSVKVNLAT